MHRPICSTAIGLFITLTPLLRPASAADIEWDANGANPPTGNFNVANNWNPNIVPGSADNAVFNRGAGVAYHVSFPGGAIFDPPLTYTIDFLRVHSNDVTFRDVSTPFTTRPSLRVANPGISIVIGQDAGEVAVLNTSLISLSGANTSIGRAAGANGTLNVTAGTFSMSGDLHVGDSGTGRLNITGGSVSNRDGWVGMAVDSIGTATVTGAGSTWNNDNALLVGVHGTGTLTIEAGGRVSGRVGSVGHNIFTSSNATGTVTVTGSGSIWTNTDYIIVGNNGGTGRLRIEAGGTVSDFEGNVGVGSGTGTVTVTGAGSDWTNSGALNVGNGGTGTLRIEAGGSVSASNSSIGSSSNGGVTVTGASSNLMTGGLFIGANSSGTLTIENGGAVLSTGATLGVNNIGIGTAVVRGPGSVWTSNGTLIVGEFGRGALAIENGGAVSSTEARIGDGDIMGFRGLGTVAVSGTGGTGTASTWTNTGQLIVGNSATGALEITSGGRVSNTNSVIGSRSGSSGAVNVSGAGSIWNINGNLTVGDLGAGSLTIADGGEVVVTGSLLANTLSRARLEGGKLTVNQFGNGGVNAFDWRSGTLRFTAASGLTIGSAGPFGASLALDAGQHLNVDNTLTIDSGAELFASGGLSAGSIFNSGDLILSSTTVNGPVTNAAGANITTIGNVIFNDNVAHNGDEIRTSPTNTTVFFGNVTGAGPFTGTGAVRFEGTFSPGNSPAVVTLEGDLALDSDAILNMELGGTSEGSQYDRLDVAGTLSIDGALEVSLLNQFQPTIGNRFDLFDSLALDGRFDNINLPLLPAGQFWDTAELYTSGTISVSAIPEPTTVCIWIAASICVGAVVLRPRHRC